MDARISLLGGFAVSVGGSVVTDQQWSRRNATALVKVLALTEGRRLHREQVIDVLWPDLSPEQAGPRLHQAAHYARRALGEAGQGVVLRHDFVELLPDSDVAIDAVDFRAAAEAALAGSDAVAAGAATAALELYGGVLLPDDLYEPWAEEHRESLALLHRELLRVSGRWEELVAADPADEQAHLTLARAHADRGDVRAALRQLERLELVLRRELGTAPGVEAESLRAELMAMGAESTPTGSAPTETAAHRAASAGRAHEQWATPSASGSTAAQGGRGGAVLITGPPGVGKSSVLDLADVLAQRAGWRTGRGTASAVEGPWPYAPVLEALGDLCRRHPALLDGLDDRYREELDRALSERQVSWSGESAHQRLFVAAAELLRLGRRRPRPAAGRRRRARGRRGITATAPLPRTLRRHRPGAAGAGAPAHPQPGAGGGPRPAWSHEASGPASTSARSPSRRTRRLLAERFPDLDEPTQHHIWAVSGGLPFTALELGAAAAAGREPATISSVPPDALRALQRAALLGLSFTTDEFLAVAGVGEARGLPAPRDRARPPGGRVVRDRLPVPPRLGARGGAGDACRPPRGAQPGSRWLGSWRGSVPRPPASRTSTSPQASRARPSPTCSRPWRPPVPSVPTATPSSWSTGSCDFATGEDARPPAGPAR